MANKVQSGPRATAAQRFVAITSSVPLNLVSSLLVLKQDLRYKLTFHLRLNVFNDEAKLNSNRARIAQVTPRLRLRFRVQRFGVWGLGFGG